MELEMGREPFVMDDNTLVIIPKNALTEQRVMLKRTVHKTDANKVAGFLDIREWWYKDGPTNEPIATKKGTMIHRDQIPRVILAILRGLIPGELGSLQDDIEAAAKALRNDG